MDFFSFRHNFAMFTHYKQELNLINACDEEGWKKWQKGWQKCLKYFYDDASLGQM